MSCLLTILLAQTELQQFTEVTSSLETGLQAEPSSSQTRTRLDTLDVVSSALLSSDLVAIDDVELGELLSEDSLTDNPTEPAGVDVRNEQPLPRPVEESVGRESDSSSRMGVVESAESMDVASDGSLIDQLFLSGGVMEAIEHQIAGSQL